MTLNKIKTELLKISSLLVASREDEIRNRIENAIRGGKIKRKQLPPEKLKEIDDLTDKIINNQELFKDIDIAKYGGLIGGWVRDGKLDVNDKEKSEDINRQLKTYDDISKRWKGRNLDKLPKEVSESYMTYFNSDLQKFMHMDMDKFLDALMTVNTYDNRGRTFDTLKGMNQVGEFEYNDMPHRVYRIDKPEDIEHNTKMADFMRGGPQYCVLQKDSGYWGKYGGPPYYHIVRENAQKGGLQHAGNIGFYDMLSDPKGSITDDKNNGMMSMDLFNQISPIIQKDKPEEVDKLVDKFFQDERNKGKYKLSKSLLVAQSFGKKIPDDMIDKYKENNTAQSLFEKFYEKPKTLKQYGDFLNVDLTDEVYKNRGKIFSNSIYEPSRLNKYKKHLGLDFTKELNDKKREIFYAYVYKPDTLNDYKKYFGIDFKNTEKEDKVQEVKDQVLDAFESDYKVTEDPRYLYIYDEHHQNMPDEPNMTKTDGGWSNAEWLLSQHGQKTASSVELIRMASRLFVSEEDKTLNRIENTVRKWNRLGLLEK